MKQLLSIALVTLVLTACSLSHSDSKETEKFTQVIFECDHQEAITVRYYPDSERAVLIRHSEEIELQQERTASGFLYSNGPNSIAGKGDNLVVHVGRMAAINCRPI